MRIGLTGASGFLGRALQARLGAHEVICIDRAHGIDITYPEQCRQIPATDLIIHVAAQTFVPAAYEDPVSFYQTNVIGTLNMLEYARHAKARFLFISSYVYGRPVYLPIDEVHPVQALNPYMQSKLMAEELCIGYSRDFGIDYTILRPFNIYGPGQLGHFLLPKLVTQAMSGSSIEVFDTHPKRDYILVDDVADAIIKAVNVWSSNELFNLGSGKSYSIPEIVHILARLLNKRLNVKDLAKPRASDIPDTKCNFAKATAKLGWAPSITLEAGLQKMIDFQYTHL